MQQPKNPLHGITLEKLLTELIEQYGFAQLAAWLPIRCFSQQPSLKSSLAFLRKTPWARAAVEAIYLQKPTAGSEFSAQAAAQGQSQEQWLAKQQAPAKADKGWQGWGDKE